MQNSKDDGFHQLWPTLFLRRKIENTDAANSELLRLIFDEDRVRPDMTVNYLSDNIFSAKDPAIDWLRQCINKTVADYLQRLSIDYDVDWAIQGWANVNRSGDYHNLHNHPHSYLSGTYYVQMPPDIVDGNRSDINPGAISFFDPRPQANMNAIKNDGQIDPELRILPEAGLMLLWPSFIHHFVHPNLSEEPRVSISFNVVLKNKEKYLPV